MIATMHEGYYPVSQGFRNVYAQIVAEGPAAILHPVPEFIAASRPGAPQTMPGFGLAQVVVALLVLLMCFRDGAVMGAGLGVLLVFALVVTNAYYQGMWGVFALACALYAPGSLRARLGLAVGCLVFGSRYVMQHFGDLGYAEDYFACWTTFAFALAWGFTAPWSRPTTRPGSLLPHRLGHR
jgi:hypothetical protein